MKQTLLKFFTLLCFPCLSFAAERAAGLGRVANNMMEPVGLASDFVNSGCFLIGGSFLFASVIKYVEHRRSPLMVPISTVVFLLIAGIVLILLPFTAWLTNGTVHYTLVGYL